MAKSALEKEIDRKTQEMIDLKAKLLEVEAFLQGLTRAQSLSPKGPGAGRNTTQLLRHGSDMAKARDYLKDLGHPAHITDILEGIGKDRTSKAHRLSVGGSLSSYVRKGEIFIRTDPNTFGLIGMEVSNAPGEVAEDSPPNDFGELEDEEVAESAKKAVEW